MIERFGSARGLRIPFWKGWQAEIWFCPKGAVIPPHIHRTIDSFIIYFLGTMRVTVDHTTRIVFGPVRRRESTGRLILATRYIPAGVRHCAEVLGRFAVFMNVEHCHAGSVSASRDFIPVP